MDLALGALGPISAAVLAFDNGCFPYALHKDYSSKTGQDRKKSSPSAQSGAAAEATPELHVRLWKKFVKSRTAIHV